MAPGERGTSKKASKEVTWAGQAVTVKTVQAKFLYNTVCITWLPELGSWTLGSILCPIIIPL